MDRKKSMKKLINSAMERLHIIKHQQGWVLWKGGDLVVPDIYTSKESAIVHARTHGPSDELIIHRQDGTIERIERANQ
jgi:Uncharacterized protein conserved in bacteria (DUF2188)